MSASSDQLPSRGSKYDLIIVGSGIAGLYASLLAAAHGRVLLVTKGALEESNTRYAQGGIAVALAAGDSPELHLRDTIVAGDGLCHRDAVAVLTQEAPRCISDLLALGVPFDRDGDDLAWTLEAAHSYPRVLHAGGDATGQIVERTLAATVRSAGVTILQGALCTRVLTDTSGVTGIEFLQSDGSTTEITASRVVLATGGAGQLYARTTNPAVATGDGLVAAFRAGAQLMDLEFMQFHPTALALDGAPPFLISEAVRGEGGILRDVHGHAFMAGYHPDAELAPRDVVARAIHRQVLETGAGVTLDVTHLEPALIERRFPSIVAFCRRWNVDPVSQPIPVSPAAHYLMGGIRTDLWGRTTVPGLFACGEVACTGVHGANRLASNSLLEGLVFARRTARCIVEDMVGHRPPDASGEWSPLGIGGAPVRQDVRAVIRDIMWRDVGLLRTSGSLSRAQRALAGLEAAAPDAGLRREDHETHNLHLLAELTAGAALAREESRGGHFRTDFPQHNSAWRGHIVLSLQGLRYVPLAAAKNTSSAAAHG